LRIYKYNGEVLCGARTNNLLYDQLSQPKQPASSATEITHTLLIAIHDGQPHNTSALHSNQ